MSDALVIVDIQNDFMPGGTLEVPAGDEVVPIANQLIPHFELVVATQDWHPPDHGSFAANHPGHQPGEVIELDGLQQILWPVHCLRNSTGAELFDELDEDELDRIFYKGTDASVDSYSGFIDNGHRRATGLGDFLKAQGTETVYILGVATDYCVKFTALDACELGFQTFLIEDACRGVNLQPGDVDKALTEMRAAGVTITNSAALSPR